MVRPKSRHCLRLSISIAARIFLGPVAACLVAGTAPVWASDIFWIKDPGDAEIWDDYRNWSAGIVPDYNASVHVENGGTVVVTDDTPRSAWTEVSGNNGLTSTINVVDGGAMHVDEELSVGLYASSLGAAGVLNQTGGTVQAGQLTVGEQLGAIGLYRMTGGLLQVRYATVVGYFGVGQFDMVAGTISSNDHFFVGNVNGSGFFNQTGGNVSFGGNASIGDWGAGTLVVNDSDGPASFTAGGDMIVGNHDNGSTGTVSQSAAVSATVTVNSLKLGKDPSASGTYNLGGNASLTLTGGGLTVGDNGTGTFNMSGNSTLTTNTNQFVNVGNWGSGAFNMSGGNVNNSGGLMVGWYGGSTGAVDQSGGVMNAAWTAVGYQGAGTYHLSGGTLNAGGSLEVGQQGAGTFVQDGGTINVTTLTVLGETGRGNYTLNEGTLNAGTGDQPNTRASLTINYNSASPSTFTQNGGTVNVGNGSWLQIAQGDGTQGTYNMNGGLLNGGANGISVSGGGTGTFNQTGGTVIAGDLSLATWNHGSSTYNLSGGNLTLSGNVLDGVGGTGRLNLDGGTLAVGGGVITVDYLNIGNAALSNGFHTMTDGQTTTVNNSFVVGGSGTGVFNHNGGGVTTPTLGLGINAGSSGTYNLSGGNLTVNGNIVSGAGGSTLNLDGGALSLGGSMTVNNLTLGNAAGSSANYTHTSAHAVTLNNGLTVGGAGSGVYEQTSGTLQLGSALRLADQSGSSGTYNLRGGLLAAPAATLSAGGGVAHFNFTGGALQIGTVGPSLHGLTQDNTDGPSLLDVTTNDTEIDGNYRLLGGTATIGNGQKLTVFGSILNGGHGTTLNVGTTNGPEAKVFVLASIAVDNLNLYNGNVDPVVVSTTTVTHLTSSGSCTITNPVVLRDGGTISNDANLNLVASLSTSSGTIDGAGNLTVNGGLNIGGTLGKTGLGVMNVFGPQHPRPGAVLNLNGGVVNMNSDTGSSGNEVLSINTSVPLNFTGSQHLAGLGIGPNTTVTLSRPAVAFRPQPLLAASSQVVLVAGSLSMDATADLDLKDNSMVVHGGGDPLGTFLAVEASIANAFDNANLDGHGIKSSAIVDPFATGLGSALNSLLADAFAPLDAMNGQPLTLVDTIVRYTYMGDATLDGVVNDDDASLIGGFYDNGTSAGHHWFEGDFTHDGLINDDDVSILSGNYSPDAPPLSARKLAARYGAKFAAAWEASQAPQAVPEPSTLALGSLGLIGLVALACRRRRRKGA